MSEPRVAPALRLAPKTIRGRVALATFAVLTVVLAVAGVVIDEVVEGSARNQLDAALATEAEAIASLVRVEQEKVEIEAGEGVKDVTPTLFDTPKGGAYFQVTAAPRPALKSASLVGSALPAPSPLDLAPPALPRERRFAYSTVTGPFEAKVRMIALAVSRPVMPEDAEDEDEAPKNLPRTLVVVQVARSLAGVERERGSVRGALETALPLALLLGTVGAFLVARRATVPIARLSGQAASIGAASLATRLDSGRVAGELRDLAGTLNQAFDRLAATVERERRFAADAAHELRTPLAVLRARLELALTRDRGPEEYRAALSTALDAGLRLGRVVDALLLLGRAEAGAGVRGRLDLRGPVANAVEAVSPLARTEGVEVTAALPDEEVEVVGDATLLERLVSNLLENAVRHGASGGRVETSLRAEGGSAVIWVLDRGPGFPPEIVPRLFERFARGDQSRTRATGGAGLGLAIARAIARAHGGDVTAEQRAGGGAEISVTLPLAVRERPA